METDRSYTQDFIPETSLAETDEQSIILSNLS